MWTHGDEAAIPGGELLLPGPDLPKEDIIVEFGKFRGKFAHAWGGLYDRDKVELCLSVGHKTTRNIKARGAFTVSFADAAHVAEADYAAVIAPLFKPGAGVIPGGEKTVWRCPRCSAEAGSPSDDKRKGILL